MIVAVPCPNCNFYSAFKLNKIESTFHGSCECDHCGYVITVTIT